jgi:anti-anti-sigma factor
VSDPSQRQLVATVAAVAVDRCRVTVAGELDFAAAPWLWEKVSAALNGPACRDLVVDLSGVTFLDAGGVGALARMWQACHRVGGRITVFGAYGMVAEILHLTGVAPFVGLPTHRSGVRPTPVRVHGGDGGPVTDVQHYLAENVTVIADRHS